MILEGVLFNDCLHDLLRVAFWREIRPYCHGVSTCEDFLDVLRRHGENVARIRSYPEGTPVQSFVASKNCWPKMKTVETQWVLSILSAMQKQEYNEFKMKFRIYNENTYGNVGPCIVS